MTIDDVRLRPDANNLTLVRLVLASAVIVSHSWWRVTGVTGADPFSAWLGVPLSIYAVDGFFFLSGFLVYPSLVRRGRIVPFVLARAARLWPALAVSVLGTAIVGAFVTAAAPADYWRGETLRFVFGNLTLLKAQFYLTGIHCGDVPCKINGSLWTLPWEAFCYGVLALLLTAGLAGRRAMLVLVLPATLLLALLWDVPGLPMAVENHAGHFVGYTLSVTDRLWTLFALGCAASLLRDRIRLSWAVLAVLFAVNLLAHRWGAGVHVRAVFTGYAVLCFGFLTARRRAVSARWPDYSYGMYIYAFPVMMAAAALWPGLGVAGLAIVNFALTLPLAALSWHAVERPVLELVRRRSLAAGAR